MKYCKRCLYPENHPLHIVFDQQGVCSGCRIHEEKDQIDWEERKKRLLDIVKNYRNRTRTIHDCIIPVSGARDSYFIVHFVKNILGMHPLLVNYNKQYNTRMGIRNLAYLRTLFGCDIMQMTVSPGRVQRITRETLKRAGSMYWHCLAGHTVFPVQMAVKFKIPLIIWGVHQGIDQVGMFSHLDEVEMTRKYRQEHDLMGLESEDLLDGAADLNEQDIEQFSYPHDRELSSVGVRGIYLNNYVRWDSKAQHELMIKEHSYETMRQQRTFDTYNDVDCFHYSGIHDLIKFYKWGYGKVTDHASREIRLKRMTRETGINLIDKFQNVKIKDLSLFLDWIKMEESDFWNCIDAHRDPLIWKRLPSGAWKLKDSVVNHRNDKNIDDVRLDCVDECEFQLNAPRDAALENEYVLIGRGWVD